MTKISTIPPKLEAAIKKDNLVIFVGAGCSMPLGLPSWKKLVEEILQDLDDKYGEASDTNFKNILNGVKNNNKSLFDALSKIENDSDNGATFKIKSREFINSQIEEISKNLPEQSNVHNLLWEISSKIITTNYDKFLEKYIPNSISPKVFYNSNAFQSLKSQSNNAEFLYKIHGDYEDPSTIILFESDYNDIYKNENYNTDTLAAHFKEKTLLFIGFSLTDPFVNDLFIKIKKMYEGYSIKEHFIFTTKNDDFIKYDVTPIKIKNWDDDLLNYLLELKKIKPSPKVTNTSLTTTVAKKKTEEEELTIDDVNNIVDLITKKTDELLFNSGNKELAKEVKDLRIKLDKLLYGKVDHLQEVDKPFRHNDLQALFDTIYSSEKLNIDILQKIQEIRNNSSKYKWYDRSVIVSAICCSLIHFNKVDEYKINLLIDFINDSEEKVWQKATTSLFITLNHLGNKWLRFNSIKIKVKSLNQNLKVQDSFAAIIKAFNIGLNNVSMIDSELFDNQYFNESPFNYFFPYHQDENPAFELVYENYEGGDIDDYITFLDEIPIPDQIKYLLCSTKRKEKNDPEKNKKILEQLNNVLKYNSLLFPYSTYIQEIISFYKFFPKFKHEEKLKSQLKLTETPLKDYLLNQKEKHSALGAHFMREENWSQAIVNFKESIKLNSNDIEILLNLANCYYYSKDSDNEFLTRIKVQNLESLNEYNLQGLFHIFFKHKKDFHKALDIADQLININNETADYYHYKGISLKELKEYEKALEDLNLAIELNPDNHFYYVTRADVYFSLNKNKKSLSDWNNALKFETKDASIYFNRSLVYSRQEKYIDAIKDLDAAILIDKNSTYLLNRATNNLCLFLFDEALLDIEKANALNLEKEYLYHFYANYYRLTKEFDKAFEYIQKAEEISKDNSFTGTKATIYASSGDLEKFYLYLEQAFKENAQVNQLYPDILEKFKNDSTFKALLQKYNQIL